MAAFTEVGARLGLDIKPFEAALARSASSLGEFKKRASKNLDVGDAGKAFAFALGLSIDKVGDTFGRMWTGVTREAEESFRKMADLSETNTDLTIRNMRELLTLEQQYQLLLRDRERILNNPTKSETPSPGAWETIFNSIGGAMDAVLPGSGKPFRKAADTFMASRATEAATARTVNAEEDKKKLNENQAALTRVEAERRQKIEEASRKNAENQRDSLSSSEQVIAAHYDLLAIDRLINNSKDGSLDKLDLEIARADKVKEIRELTLKHEQDMETAAEKVTRQQEKQARAAEKTKDATVAAMQAYINLQEATADRSGLTVEEVAKGGGGITQTDKARAREIIRLEEQAKRQRAQGFTAESEASMERAGKLRESMGILKSDERDPLRGEKRNLTEALREMDDARKSAAELSRAAGQLSGAASDMKSAAASVSSAFESVPVN